MSIINPNTTVEVADIVKRIKLSNLVLYKKILQSVADGFDLVWNNKNFTPQQIFDEFGTEAKDLFVLSGSLQQILKNANPSYEPLSALKPFTINENGTVTITEA